MVDNLLFLIDLGYQGLKLIIKEEENLELVDLRGRALMKKRELQRQVQALQDPFFTKIC